MAREPSSVEKTWCCALAEMENNMQIKHAIEALNIG